jgi:hypothetical protein
MDVEMEGEEGRKGKGLGQIMLFLDFEEAAERRAMSQSNKL